MSAKKVPNPKDELLEMLDSKYLGAALRVGPKPAPAFLLPIAIINASELNTGGRYGR